MSNDSFLCLMYLTCLTVQMDDLSLIVAVNVSIMLNLSVTNISSQSHNRRRVVAAEACDLRMTPVFSTGLLIQSNMDPRHFYSN